MSLASLHHRLIAYAYVTSASFSVELSTSDIFYTHSIPQHSTQQPFGQVFKARQYPMQKFTHN